MLTEKQIVDAVRNGRREGQNEMVGRFAPQIFSMIVKQVPDMMDAQELTQDTFLKAFRSISTYNPAKARLGTWLCRIAYHHTLDFLKRRHPVTLSIEDRLYEQTDISDDAIEAELSTGKEERIERLQVLMKELPNEEQMLLTLYYFDDQPLTEIAYITGIDAKVLANRLYRIRKKLYKKLTVI